jgi:predicted dehydrogenase
MGDALRFGLVGTGYWADEVHAVGIAGCSDAELVGVWGRDPDKAAALAAKRDATPYARFDDLLGAVDALAFAVPPQVQLELALRAARAGKHLLLEKPVATELAAADELCAAAAEHDVAGLVFFTERFVPEREAWLTERSAAGALGGRATWLARLDTPGNPFAASPWRREDGALWDVGPHALSVLIPMLGPVTAVTGARGHGDFVSLVLSHDSAATSSVELSLTMPAQATRFEVEAYDEAGWHARPAVEFEPTNAHRRAVAELVGLVRSGRREHRCDLRFGRDVVAVLEQAEKAVGRR